MLRPPRPAPIAPPPSLSLGRRDALRAGAALLAAPRAIPAAGLLLAPRLASAAAPLAVRVTTLEAQGRPLCESAWLEAQWAEVSRLLGGVGVALGLRPVRSLPGASAAITSRADRDSFATALEPRVVNVFIIASLADVDEPGRMRKGVHWRPTGRPDLHYVLLIASAPRGVLAHELGHFFGLAHSSVRDNLMSYSRSEGGSLFLDRRQGARVRETARELAAKGEL
ncbi:MAG: matrixin family metalloprotease [Polyangiaceae bacterium]|jgi:Matrixin|nr:matrixin family metalloprotease [Polyangiaceae bacterium]